MKKAAEALDTFQRTTHGGGGCGCFATGCGIVALLFFTLCIGSYFMTMHTSIPLSWIEAAIEEDGNVEVEGLRGSISTGFEIDLLRFQSEEFEGKWNELHNVKFSYNGFISMLTSRRLIINEASVGSATIYAELEGSELGLSEEFDGEDVAEEFADEWSDMQDEFQGNDSDDLKELRVDLISANNVALVDPNTGDKLEFRKVEFRNFQILKSQIVRLGELEILSDQIDLQTGKSKLFPDEPVAWNLSGHIKTAANKCIRKDFPFDIDFAIEGQSAFRMQMDLFDGQLLIKEPYGKKREFQLVDFSPGEYFDMSSGLTPASWNVSFTIQPETFEVPAPPAEQNQPEQTTEKNDADEKSEDETSRDADIDDSGEDRETPSSKDDSDRQADDSDESKSDDAENKPAAADESIQPAQPRKPRMIRKRKHHITIQSGGSFVLGETRYEIETEKVTYGPGREQMSPEFIVAKGQLDGETIEALIVVRGGPPYFEIDLRADGVEPRDLWSRLFYSDTFDHLDEQQRGEVEKAILKFSPETVFEGSKPLDF